MLLGSVLSGKVVANANIVSREILIYVILGSFCMAPILGDMLVICRLIKIGSSIFQLAWILPKRHHYYVQVLLLMHLSKDIKKLAENVPLVQSEDSVI